MRVDNKRNKRKRNLAVGDVVLVTDKETYRYDWPIGKVTEAIVSDVRQQR